MKKVIIYNAPPASGKDQACDFKKFKPVTRLMFKEKLIEITCVIHGITRSHWDEIYTRELKEIPSPLFFGLSPRQALIKVSETVIKPSFGQDYFGKALARQIEEADTDLVEVSDGGFPEEIQPIYDVIQPKDLMIVRIHRPGYTFNGDSRNYIKDEDVHPDTHVFDLYNNGTLEEFEEKVLRIANSFVLDLVDEENRKRAQEMFKSKTGE